MVDHKVDDLVLVEEPTEVPFELLIDSELNIASCISYHWWCDLRLGYSLELLSLINVTSLYHPSFAFLDDHLVRANNQVMVMIRSVQIVFE